MRIMKTKIKGMLSIICVIVFGSGFFATCFAINLANKISLTPKCEVKTEYDSNIFSESTHEIEDTLLTLAPGFSVELKDIGDFQNYVSAGYNIGLVSYLKKNNNNYQYHTPYLLMAVKSPFGFYVYFNERYHATADPYGSSNNYRIGQKTQRYENSLDLTFGYQYNIYSLELLMKNYMTRYDELFDQWQDRTDNVISLALYSKLTESKKTSFLFEYRLTLAEYNKQNDNIETWTDQTSQDYQMNDIMVGVRFEPGSKINGAIKFGWGTKGFDNEKDNFNRPYEDNNSWLIDAQVDLDIIKDKTNVGFQFIRSIQGSPDSDAASYIDTFLSFNLKYNLKKDLIFQGGLSWVNDDYRNEYPDDNDNNEFRPNKYFNTYGINLGVEYKLPQPENGDEDDYDEGPIRKRDITAGIFYKYESKHASHSDYSAGEYSKNVISAVVKGSF